MDKKLWIVFLVGIFLRLILSAVTFHSDIAAFFFAGQVFLQGHILNFYDYLFNLPQDSPILGVYPAYLFNYPPMVYLFFTFPSFIANIFTGSTFLNLFLYNFPETLGSGQLFLHLLLFKLPYLIFDLLTAFLFLKFFDSKKEKFLAVTLWLFNPVNLYATYMIGQFDIIPTFFVILALYLAMRRGPSLKNLILASLALGVGACFKIYPLFLLIPLASLTQDWKKRIGITIIGFLPYLLMILPFLPSKGFRSTALLANQTLKSLYAQIPLSGGEAIFLFLALLVFFYLVFLHIPSLPQILWQRFFIILLLFFVFTHYHPQWFLWLTPFFPLALIASKFKDFLAILVSLISFAGLIFFFDPGLSLGLFSPLSPNFYHSQSIWQILNLKVDYNFSRSLLQTLFAGTAFYFLYRYFPKTNKG